MNVFENSARFYHPEGATKFTDTVRETADRQTAAATARTAGPPRYDYTKSFAQQIEDYKNGLFPKNDALLVGETSKVLRDIGFNA